VNFSSARRASPAIEPSAQSPLRTHRAVALVNFWSIPRTYLILLKLLRSLVTPKQPATTTAVVALPSLPTAISSDGLDDSTITEHVSALLEPESSPQWAPNPAAWSGSPERGAFSGG
jgi:hypothetical protein